MIIGASPGGGRYEAGASGSSGGFRGFRGGRGAGWGGRGVGEGNARGGREGLGHKFAAAWVRVRAAFDDG